MIRPTLPGSIPGLLRRGSPVIVTLAAETTIHGVWISNGLVAVSDGGLSDVYEVGVDVMLVDIAIDLSDPTGRAHAAWWLAERLDEAEAAFARLDDVRCITGRPVLPDIMGPAAFGDDLHDEQIDMLRRVVLAVAGLEVSDG